jgi:hypothetical protein
MDPDPCCNVIAKVHATLSKEETEPGLMSSPVWNNGTAGRTVGQASREGSCVLMPPPPKPLTLDQRQECVGAENCQVWISKGLSKV